MTLSMKQTHREQPCACQGGGIGEEWTESLGLADAIVYRIDKPQILLY